MEFNKNTWNFTKNTWNFTKNMYLEFYEKYFEFDENTLNLIENTWNFMKILEKVSKNTLIFVYYLKETKYKYL